jgi:hypothetical protein
MKAHDHFDWEDRFSFMLNMNDWWLVNMGVVGGSYLNMKRFYGKFKEIRILMEEPHFNADMWICQYLLRSQLQPCELLMGEPVCSEFKKYENNREDVFFIHK